MKETSLMLCGLSNSPGNLWTVSLARQRKERINITLGHSFRPLVLSEESKDELITIFVDEVERNDRRLGINHVWKPGKSIVFRVPNQQGVQLSLQMHLLQSFTLEVSSNLCMARSISQMRI